MPTSTGQPTSEDHRIALLSSTLLRAKQAYYYKTPICTDAEYDAMEDELRRLDPTNSVLSMVGAPFPADSILSKVRHTRPMGSLSKVTSKEEFLKWAKQHGSFHASVKCDGGSIAAYYENGKLKCVVSRGSGEEGEDITANAAMFKNLPSSLPEPCSAAVRLEVVLRKDDWKAADPDQKSNPRNVACGIIGRKDGFNAHLITAMAFDIEYTDGRKQPTTEANKFGELKTLGFLTASYIERASIDDVLKWFDAIDKLRNEDSLDFWIDGIVVRLESLKAQEELGFSSGCPNGQVAWKFTPPGAHSTLNAVDWQVGATGAVTPVGRIEPVRIGGTTVSNVMLNNMEFIENLGIGLGATLEVVKAGDIIPYVRRVVSWENRDKYPTLVPPTECPVCETSLVNKENVDGSTTTVLFCPNPCCQAKVTGQIERWFKSAGVLGMGEALVEAMVERGGVKNIGDAFECALSKESAGLLLNGKTTFGLKRAELLAAEIEKKTRTMSLAQFIGGFGTRCLGVRRATLMIEANPELSALSAWFDDSLLNSDFAQAAGVPQMGRLIHEGIQENLENIKSALRYVQVTEATEQPAKVLGGVSANGKTYCITGTLPSGKKKAEYRDPLAAKGHLLVDDVKKGLDFLVVSDPSVESNKTKKALKLGIQVISEDELIAACS